MQKANPKSTVAPKVHRLNFGMIRCLFRYSTDAGYISLIVRFNPLLLRLLGEISLSLLCSHSSWGSTLDLAPPLYVGRLRASVLCSDRMGLKEQLIRGLWLTQAGGREGYGMRGEPAAAEASVTLHQHKVHRVFSRGSCPWIMGPWQWQAAQAPRRGVVDSDLCLHTVFLVTAAAALAFPAHLWCPHCGAAAHAHLWNLFRQCSESPLLVHPETMVSCLFSRSKLFPGLPPG